MASNIKGVQQDIALSGTIPAMIRNSTVFALLAVVSLSIIAAAGAPKSSGGFENRRWRIAKYRNADSGRKDENGLVEPKLPADIAFSHGRVQGSPGCGGWGGTYELAGNKLKVSAGLILAGLCSSEGFAQDRAVINAFKGELRIERSGDHVYLRDDSGKAQVMLVPYRVSAANAR